MPQTKWTNEFLDKMRITGDPPADRVAEILWKNRDRAVMDDLRVISMNHHLNLKDSVESLNLEVPLSKEEVEIIAEYFALSDQFVNTITEEDKRNIKISSDIFKKYGFNICALLFFKSLPTGYMCPKPGHVLHTTKLLEEFAARRVLETAQYVFAVNTENWYEPHNPGIEAILKVRLMHAGMRIGMLYDKRPGHEWDMDMGIPINQADLTLTNLLFSLATIEGLDQMAIHLFEEERKAIFHTWQKIGQAMGICEEMCTSDYRDVWNQYRTILKRQVSTENPAGPPLTNALLNAMNEISHLNMKLESLEDITMYFLNDKRASKSLGLHTPTFFDKISSTVIHSIASMRIWQRLFHHQRSGVINRLYNKVANGVIAKKFNLGEYAAKHPGVSPLEAFTKVMLGALKFRDMRNFEKMKPEDQKKKFFIDDELYLAWDLGSFKLDVDPKK
jgi:hypothetical protein